MVVVNRRQFAQERLAKDDIRLLIEGMEENSLLLSRYSRTRLELLIGKLKRMLKQ